MVVFDATGNNLDGYLEEPRSNPGATVDSLPTFNDDLFVGGIGGNVYYFIGEGSFLVMGDRPKVYSNCELDDTYFPVSINGVVGTGPRSVDIVTFTKYNPSRASHVQASELLTVLYDSGGFLTGAKVDAIDRVHSYVERIDPSYTPELHPVAEHHYLDDSRTFGNDSDAE